MTSDLLLYPVSNEGEALAGVSDGEIIHPAPQDRVDQLNHPIYRLGLKSPEHVLELAQQRRTLFQLWRVMRSPHLPLDATKAAEIESQEAETLPSVQIHDVALLFIDFDLQFGELLPKPLVHRTN